MPVPKRYFHVSQEINHDPEMWQFTTEFGDRALRTWLQILVYLDKSGNQWRTTGDWVATLSRTVRQSVANVSRQIRWLTANQWLTIREVAADGSTLVLQSPNWAKYYRTQEHKGSGKNPDQGAGTAPLLTIPSLSPPEPTPKIEEKIGSEDAVVNGTKHKVVSVRGSVYPEGFEFNERAIELAKAYGLNPHKELAAFRDHHVAKGSIFKDWQAAFRTWLRNAPKFQPKGMTR